MKAVSFMHVRPPGYNAESAKAAEVADERKLDKIMPVKILHLLLQCNAFPLLDFDKFLMLAFRNYATTTLLNTVSYTHLTLPTIYSV